ncbi:MAG: hypothetical protein LBV22_01500 [Mycoplasmataceae bacterium]|nr:hypothetical protein [Mycoplasmataceae bacterium]
MSGRKHFDIHADNYFWECGELDLKFTTSRFYTGSGDYVNEPRSLAFTPIEISSTPTYLDIYLSENTDIERKINHHFSRRWKAEWEPFFDRSLIFWKYTEYYDAFFCYKFNDVIETLDDIFVSEINPNDFRTNWTLKTSLTTDDIHFFQKKDIPDEASQRYEDIKEFFLLNNELTFNSRMTLKGEIPSAKYVMYHDSRKNIRRCRTLLNN